MEIFSVIWVGLLYVTLLTVTPPVTDAEMCVNGKAGAGKFAPGS